MIRRLAVSVSFLLAGAVQAAAQHPKPHSSEPRDTLTHKFAGTWEGTLASPHGSADGLKLTLAHDKGAWTASMTMPPGQPMQAGTISDVKVHGGGLTWTQSMRQMSCTGSATLIGGTLKGETVCGHLSMGFVLTRK